MFQLKRSKSLIEIGLNHGPVNAMDLEMIEALLSQLRELETDDCRAIVLTGNGRVFSAGIDLKRWLAEDEHYVEPFLIGLETLFETVFSFSKPIIAKIDGAAIAGGCMVATACDYRVIAPNAKIGILESRLGVPLPMTAIEIVRHVAEPAAFRRLVTVGATFAGESAVRVGLADEVGEGSELEATVARAASELTALPPAAFQLTKKQVRGPVLKRARENRQELFSSYLEIWKSSSTRMAIEAYVQQRLS